GFTQTISTKAHTWIALHLRVLHTRTRNVPRTCHRHSSKNRNCENVTKDERRGACGPERAKASTVRKTDGSATQLSHFYLIRQISHINISDLITPSAFLLSRLRNARRGVP